MRTPNRRIHNTYTDSRPSGVGSSGKARKSRKKCESHVKALKKRKKAQKNIKKAQKEKKKEKKEKKRNKTNEEEKKEKEKTESLNKEKSQKLSKKHQKEAKSKKKNGKRRRPKRSGTASTPALWLHVPGNVRRPAALSGLFPGSVRRLLAPATFRYFQRTFLHFRSPTSVWPFSTVTCCLWPKLLINTSKYVLSTSLTTFMMTFPPHCIIFMPCSCLCPWRPVASSGDSHQDTAPNDIVPVHTRPYGVLRLLSFLRLLMP